MRRLNVVITMPLTKLNRLLKFVKVSISEMRRKSASKIYENPTNIDLYVHIMYFNLTKIFKFFGRFRVDSPN